MRPIRRKRLMRMVLATGITGVFAYLTGWAYAAFGQGPLFALLANWIAMSWIALLGHVVEFRLPAGYYRFRAFERDGIAHERLGIRIFKRLVRRGPLSLLNPTLRLPQKPRPSALSRLDGQMRTAEAGHAVAFMVVCVAAGLGALAGKVHTAAWVMLFNVPFNVYPVMLQRYNRLKLHNLRVAAVSALAQSPSSTNRPRSRDWS